MPIPGRDRPTLEKVALRAGVSRATASRVVNGFAQGRPGDPRRGAPGRGRAGLRAEPGGRGAWSPSAPTCSPGRTRAGQPGLLRRPVLPGLIKGVSEELDASDKQLVLTLATHRRATPGSSRYALGRHATE